MNADFELKRGALDKLLAGLPAGALVLQSCMTTMKEGVFFRIQFIEKEEIGKLRPQRKSFWWTPDILIGCIEGFPKGGVITGVSGIYEYPELPDEIASKVPPGAHVYNVEQYGTGLANVRVRMGKALSDLKMPCPQEKLAKCRQWRVFRGVKVHVAVP